MKFTPKEDIRTKPMYGLLLEEGNTVDSEKRGIPDELVERWYQNGWCEIEGRDPAPERKVRGVVLQPHSAKHAQKEVKRG